MVLPSHLIRLVYQPPMRITKRNVFPKKRLETVSDFGAQGYEKRVK